MNNEEYTLIEQYPKINEKVTTYKLKNGFEIIHLEKTNLKTKYASISVPFGLLNTYDTLREESKETIIPQGVAHFLEHRKFNYRKKDLLKILDNLGATVDAYTCLDHTMYYFTTLSNFYKCIDNLLLYVVSYKDKANKIENERKIILEEAKKPRDNPIYMANYKALNNTLINDKLKYKIIGELEDIKAIDINILKLANDYFYSPNKMKLVVCGDVDIEKVIKISQKHLKKIIPNNITLIKNDKKEPSKVKVKDEIFDIPLNNDMVFINYKLKKSDQKDPKERVKERIALEMIFYLIFSSGGYNKEKLIKEGIFILLNYDYYSYGDNNYILINISTSNMEKSIESMDNIIRKTINMITKKDVENFNKGFSKDLLLKTDNIYELGYDYSKSLYEDINIYKQIEISGEIDLDYVKKVYEKYLTNIENKSILRIYGNKKTNE